MGETLLLQGARVLPEKLQNAGFEFKFPDLETALKHILE
jgi:NAD dependent epimerase/dehydratase family enzyme